jgi:hypothetical protein
VAPKQGFGAIVSAFVYLQATSLYNNLRQRFVRLKQPKYLVGALVGGAYLYFFLVRRMWSGGGTVAADVPFTVASSLMTSFTSVAAILLLLYVLADWLFSGDGARLAFSEAEIAFLFPAPLSRTTLIQFSLLRSQLAIFFSSFLMSLLLRRGGAFGGHPLQYAFGFWLMFSTLKLHSVAASFTRERLFGMGLSAWPRRILIAVIVALLAVIGAWSMRDNLQLPVMEGRPDFNALRHWFEALVGTAPLSWLLTPFRWIAAPMFASDGISFLRALPAALALLVLHYVWAVRAQVSFEDASISHARRAAEKVAAMREGRMGQRQPVKPRSEPFALSAHGYPPTAFLWKGLIAMGSTYRFRNWLIVCVATVVLCQWLAADPTRRVLLAMMGTGLSMLGLWFVLMGPMLFQQSLRRTFERMDILKAMPLCGWQIALGELSTPITVMSFALWWLLLVGTQSALAGLAMKQGGSIGLMTHANIIALAAGVALLALPLFALMLCLPFAGMLYFPAWVVAPGTGGARGFDVMGQRLVFMLGYFVTISFAMLPAAIAGGIGFVLLNWAIGPVAGIIAAAILASATLAFELFGALRLLGQRIDNFDLSQELR